MNSFIIIEKDGVSHRNNDDIPVIASQFNLHLFLDLFTLRKLYSLHNHLHKQLLFVFWFSRVKRNYENLYTQTDSFIVLHFWTRWNFWDAKKRRTTASNQLFSSRVSSAIIHSDIFLFSSINSLKNDSIHTESIKVPPIKQSLEMFEFGAIFQLIFPFFFRLMLLPNLHWKESRKKTPKIAQHN